MSHACHRFWKCYKTFMFCSLLTRCTIPFACHAKRHLNVQKCSVPPQFFTLLTWKCASRHNSVHVFDISTSKRSPELRCFVHFDFDMCFAPQRRLLFRHLNFQKLRCFEFCHLQMCFAPQRRAIFHRSSGQLAPHPLSGATNQWKNTVFRDFPTCSCTWIFFLLRLSLF